jgi:DNA-binding MarR family transcriptional regulator
MAVDAMRDVGYLAQDISILHRLYYKDTAREFKDLGLNPTAACILLAIHDAPGINQQRVSNYLAIDKGLTTREVGRLETAAYVRRVCGKGKSLLLETTPAGDDVVDTVRRIRSDWWRRRFHDTGVTERSELAGGIERIVHDLTGRLEPEDEA